MPPDTHYFLNANNAIGALPNSGEFSKDESIGFTYILNGGPGGAKQAFLKTLGEKLSSKGYTLEYLHKAEAPEEYFGLLVPELGTMFIDGKDFSVYGPEYPGINQKYINLDDFYDYKALAGKAAKAMALYGECRTFKSKAMACLLAAEEISNDIYSGLFCEEIAETIARRTLGICTREFSDCGKQGTIKKRLLSAFTFEGIISRFDTVKALCTRVCIIDNEYGFSPLMLRALLDSAIKNGYNAVSCLSPLFKETPEHLIIPELSLAFISVSPETPYVFESYKHVRLDALADRDVYKELKPTLRKDEQVRDMLLDKARQNLFFLKCSADKLDELFAPHTDLAGASYLAEKYAEKI